MMRPRRKHSRQPYWTRTASALPSYALPSYTSLTPCLAVLPFAQEAAEDARAVNAESTAAMAELSSERDASRRLRLQVGATQQDQLNSPQAAY